MSPQNKYFDLTLDVHVPGRWYVRSPLDARGERIIPWEFFQGKPVHLESEPFVPVSHPGHALDFTLTEAGIPVVSHRFLSLCERLGVQGEAQFIPTRVEDQPERYFVLNTLRLIKCVDEARCQEVTFWEPRHGDPERIGHYRNVRGLKIDPTKVGDANIFRPWGWTVVLLVSERVKLAMEREGITGAKFIEA